MFMSNSTPVPLHRLLPHLVGALSISPKVAEPLVNSPYSTGAALWPGTRRSDMSELCGALFVCRGAVGSGSEQSAGSGASVRSG